jgi:hypothetical protein
MVDPAAGSSYIIDGTGQHTLTIPSGAETGLKLVQGFTMPVGGIANFTVDFVLSKSVIAPPPAGSPAEVEPLVTATAALDSSSVYACSVPFLTTGTYTVAFTCDPDDPNVDESAQTGGIHFAVYPQAVTVSTNQTSTVNF